MTPSIRHYDGTGRRVGFKNQCLNGVKVRVLLVAFASVAQLAEQLPCKEKVTGSKPVTGLVLLQLGWIGRHGGRQLWARQHMKAALCHRWTGGVPLLWEP
jgi:hypothetical protein